jgi:hypothetical protein
MLQTLLLNSTFEGISFISERRAFKFLAKDKVEVLSNWSEKVNFGSKVIGHPATLRLKEHVKWFPKKPRFYRYGVFKRDRHICQYCHQRFGVSSLTIDHVIPRHQKGPTNWLNCVASCRDCNRKKRNRTPEEAEMILLNKPEVPILTVSHDYAIMERHHDSWIDYIIK